MIFANIVGPDGLIIIILALVLLFGAGQLPKLARNLGEANKEFKRSQHEAEEEARSRGPAGATSLSAGAAPTAGAVPSAGASADDKVTLTKAELDALLAEREARARRESGTSPAS